MQHRTKIAIAAAATGALTLGLCTPAYAEEEASDVMDALASVSDGAGSSPSDTSDVLSHVADVPTTENGEFAIPTDPRDDLTLAVEHVGIEISIGLPFAGRAERATVEADGIVSYDNRNGTTTVPVVNDDGSVQITTVIDNASAPSRFDYTIALPAGGCLEQLDGGMVVIRDAEGGFQGGVLPAWAKDTDGEDMPTHFVVDSGVLTQVVEHDASTAYPVVADPEVGGGLLAGYWMNRPGHNGYKGASVWSTHLSAWGAAVYTQGLVGIEIVKNQGWTEWRNFPPTPVSATIEQQYKCHAQFGYAVWLSGVWWDFETARPSNPNWLWNPQKCNWV